MMSSPCSSPYEMRRGSGTCDVMWTWMDEKEWTCSFRTHLQPQRHLKPRCDPTCAPLIASTPRRTGLCGGGLHTTRSYACETDRGGGRQLQAVLSNGPQMLTGPQTCQTATRCTCDASHGVWLGTGRRSKRSLSEGPRGVRTSDGV